VLGLALSSTIRTVVDEEPLDTIHVYYVFRKHSTTDPQPPELLTDYAPQPASLVFSDKPKSYHSYYVAPPPPPAQPSAAGVAGAHGQPGKPPPAPRNDSSRRSGNPLSAISESPKPKIATAGIFAKGGSGSKAPASSPVEEITGIVGVTSKIREDKPKDPPQLFLRVQWTTFKTLKTAITDEPCDNTSVMGHPKARAWVIVPRNLLFARRESRRGVLATTVDKCGVCVDYANNKKHRKKLIECSAAGCESRRTADLEVTRLQKATGIRASNNKEVAEAAAHQTGNVQQ
jgi:hypothetical protein